MSEINHKCPLHIRNTSECSSDSDDSLVVFEFEKDCEYDLLDFDYNISDKLHNYEDDDTDVDKDNYGNIDSIITSDIIKLNKKWKFVYSAYPSNEKNPDKVHFADEDSLFTIHPIWDLENRRPWEEIARDRERFGKRIKQVESKLEDVFTLEHRNRIWKERIEPMLEMRVY